MTVATGETTEAGMSGNHVKIRRTCVGRAGGAPVKRGLQTPPTRDTPTHHAGGVEQADKAGEARGDDRLQDAIARDDGGEPRVAERRVDPPPSRFGRGQGPDLRQDRDETLVREGDLLRERRALSTAYCTTLASMVPSWRL